MSDRNTDDLANLSLGDTEEPMFSRSEDEDSSRSARKEEPAANAGVALHFPKPTILSSVLQDVAKWSDLNFVMDPGLDRPIQVFAPRKMTKDEAFQVFVASLETIGLRVLHLQGRVVKIVPMSLGRISV